jgi:hypothetical protein
MLYNIKNFMKELIMKMSNNIGSLSLFLNNPKNIDYLNYLNDNVPVEIFNFKISEKVYYLLNNIDELLICSCGKHRKFIGLKNGYRSTCGDVSCFVEKRRISCLENWGVDNPMRSKEILEKQKLNIKEKWGLEHYMLDESVQNKFKKTMLEKWNVEWPQQSSEIRKKSALTWNLNPDRNDIIEKRRLKLINKSDLEKDIINKKREKTIFKKWGDHYMNIDEIRLKIKNKYLENYGFDSPFKNSKISKKRITSYRKRTSINIIESITNDYIYIDHFYNKNETGIMISLYHRICELDFSIYMGYFKTRIKLDSELCLNCNPSLSGESKGEIEVYEFIKNNYHNEIIRNDRGSISKELDIYLPDLKLAFEFNGLYWHSELYKGENYHLEKSRECLKNNIRLFHIWEDDWNHKNEIIKSIILDKLNNSEIISSDECSVELVDDYLVKDFLNKNHISGFSESTNKLGLFYNSELVSLMILNNNLISRFCNKLNISVKGSFSKLFNHAKDEKDEMIIYSDNSIDIEDYTEFGFEKQYECSPDYYWVVDGVRKSELDNINSYRIYDCGVTKWSYFKNTFSRNNI